MITNDHDDYDDQALLSSMFRFNIFRFVEKYVCLKHTQSMAY